MKVGFIGLGIMGASMASNMMKKGGFEAVVHDIRREAAAPHLAAGATWADSPRKVAEATEVVLTSLPGPPEMEAVALGPDGLLAGMTKGKVYFDLTTNSPTLVRRVHGVFAEKGVHLLDAPVSGGPSGARSGKLALWVGGDKDVSLATALGRELNVPMRVANLALAELTEALNRGWGDRDSRIPMSLQEERAGVQVRVEESRLKAALDREGLVN